VTTYVLPVLAWAYLELGDTEQAAQVIARALTRASGYRLTLAGALRVQGLVALRQGHYHSASHALEEGLALARAMPYPHGEGRLLEVCGELHVRQGDTEAARERFIAALAIFRRLGARKDAERAALAIAQLRDK
jgi:tetratricopeptide (TPR) repeat protein